MSESSMESSKDLSAWLSWIYIAGFLGTVVSACMVFCDSSSSLTKGGYHGAVASASPEASEAALAMLEKGGNAADALVAASFAVSVTRPQSTGLGGGGFIIYHDASSGEDYALDCREVAPKAATRDMYLNKKGEAIKQLSKYGPLAAGVPGLVAGLVAFHERFGSLPLSETVQPAIRLARDGFKVDRGLASMTKKYRDMIRKYPATAAIFLKQGQPLKEGSILKQKDLARTLEAIARRGRAGFYSGEVAYDIISAMDRYGGIISIEDLKSYKPRWRDPLIGRYHSHRIVTMPPPGGGLHVVQMLNVLEGFELGAMKHNSKEHVHLLSEAMQRAYADRTEHSADPDFWKVPLKQITSKQYAEQIRQQISSDKATPANKISVLKPRGAESPQTTHISIIDGQGNAASSTQTINTGLGSKFVAEGTGVVLNNEMDDFSAKAGVPNAFGLLGKEANAIVAGKRPLSSMSPTIVFDRRGRLVMVVGTPGGSFIMTSVLQVISNRIDFQMAPSEAVFAPRVHHQWKPTYIRTERPGLPAEVVEALTALGHSVKVKAPMCNVQAIFRDPETGLLTGVSDPRGTGEPRAR